MMDNRQSHSNRVGDARERKFTALRANLLALNALYEAARAGEAGFGLAAGAAEESGPLGAGRPKGGGNAK